jgi:hypothetical protein
MTFKKGSSGNPSGRPPGVKDKRNAMRELLQPHAEDLVHKAVSLAKAGDVQALRICIDRLIPPAKEHPLNITLPNLDGLPACTAAQATVVSAVADGDLLPTEGNALSSLIENQRRSFESAALEGRLKVIEDRLGVRP